MSDSDSTGRKSWLSQLIRIGLALLTVGLSLCVAMFFALRHAPQFYRSAMAVPDADAYQAGADFETSALYLQNDMVTRESWSAWFTEQQINGWLASDMARKFPGLLPPEVSDPRVILLDDRLVAACRYHSDRVDTILVAEVDLFLTDVPDQIGARIFGTRAGWIPIPVSMWHESISRVLENAGIDLSWTEDADGVPVVLLDIPDQKMTYQDQRIHLDQLSVSTQVIELAGHSVPTARSQDSPVESGAE